jgi:hypothetical protein
MDWQREKGSCDMGEELLACTCEKGPCNTGDVLLACTCEKGSYDIGELLLVCTCRQWATQQESESAGDVGTVFQVCFQVSSL